MFSLDNKSNLRKDLFRPAIYHGWKGAEAGTWKTWSLTQGNPEES